MHIVDGCETWSVALRKERKLRVLENGVFGTEQEGSDRRVHSGELRDCTAYQVHIVYVMK